jgi:pimeloyl-ACP methyl ester carboxylesterase
VATVSAAQPRARTIEIDGASLVIREWGSGRAPAFVYWPGLNPFGPLDLIEAGATWADSYGLRVIGISAPGTGESADLVEPEQYRPSALAVRVVKLLDALAIARAAVGGFSWGASVAARITITAPERVAALVLLEGGYCDPIDEPDYVARTLDELIVDFRRRQAAFRFADLETYLGAVTSERTSRDAQRERYRAAVTIVGEDVVPRSSPEAAAAARFGTESEPTSSILGALAATRVPVLVAASAEIVAAEPEAAIALQRFRREVPHAEVELVHRAGHDVLADAPAETARLVGEWLSDKLV